MKKSVLISILLCCVCLQNKAQDYYPIPTSNMTWSANVFNIYVFFGYDHNCSIIGDTLINNNTYHKLSCYYSTFFFREVDKKVYFRDNYNVELLLYDFSLKTGDSIQYGKYFISGDALTSSGNNGKYMYLHHIDSVAISGKMRAQYNYSADLGMLPPCIEGIGFTQGYGFINLLMPMCTCGDVITFHYVKQNDTYLIHNVLSNNKSITNPEEITVYPNPVREFVNLQIPNSIKNGTVKIINSNGVFVFQKDIINGQQLKIDRNGLAAGLYILQVSEGAKVIMQKKLILE